MLVHVANAIKVEVYQRIRNSTTMRSINRHIRTLRYVTYSYLLIFHLLIIQYYNRHCVHSHAVLSTTAMYTVSPFLS